MSSVSREASIDQRAPLAAEARWPVVLTVLMLMALLVLMPARLRLLPVWVLYAVAAGIVAPLGAVAISPQNPTWRRLEPIATLGFVVVAGVGNLATLHALVAAILHRSESVSGLQLLASSIAIWVTNVVMFSLLYWQMDRGGPRGRESAVPAEPDWVFPRDEAPVADALAPAWRPQFLDYLFLGYSTATAFSTTDALPLTGRAKLAMMFESTISLVTMVVVAARAINVLG